MKLTFKRGLTAALATVMAYGLVAADTAQAQAKWPEKQVKMIVPAPPGSAPDGQIRLISQKLSEMWGQPVVVENIVGAGGIIGVDRVAKSAPDGYTFLYNTIGPIAVAESPMGPGKLPFSPSKDLIAVSLATNTPLQGTAADLIKIAMLQIHEKLIAENLDARMILQIHDELLFEVRKEHVDALSAIVKKIMEEVFTLKVPLVVDISIGKNWGEC
jgi:hypothetical protein